MKRLIVCCDGTWQDLDGKYPNNVVKMAQAIKTVDQAGVNQLVHYISGVGSFGSIIAKLGGGAFGWGLDNIIQTAYQFLCLNYEPGDQIYLFGFSRGAYTVRSLAGFIYNVGLLNRLHIRKTQDAYDIYRDRSDDTKPSSQKAKTFRADFSQEVDITFLGCWDTVGSLGIPDQVPFFPLDDIINKKYEFHDTHLNRRIQCARHAVAIDETRKVFYVTSMQKSDNADNQDLKQVWFPGDHGCVGGGTEKNRGLSDAALEWMMKEAAEQGLAVQLNMIEEGIETDPLADFEDSLTGSKRVRKLSDDPAIKSNSDESEYVYATIDDLHESVKQRWCLTDYRPDGLELFATRLDKLCP